MTKDDLYFIVESKRQLEFVYNDKRYVLSYDKNSKNEDCIYFGIIYEQQEFSCFNELYAKAKIENSFFKEMLDDINIVS